MNLSKQFFIRVSILGLSSLGLVACNTPSSNGTGQVSLNVTDAPIDGASKVMVTFNSVELHGAEDKTITFDKPVQINLLDLSGSKSAGLLVNQPLKAGDYQWIKLGVDTTNQMATYIEMKDGTDYDLTIPSGSESGLKLVRGFTVAQGGGTDFTIDFNLRKSIVGNSQGYKLKPALRMVDNLEVGHVKGTVAATLLQDSSCTSGNSVYVFSGKDVTPTDEYTNSNVLTTANVTMDTSGIYNYSVGFLTAGDYTFAFTCQSADDDPEAQDANFKFVAQSNVTVAANTTTDLNFQ